MTPRSFPLIALAVVAACAPDSAPVRELAPAGPSRITFGTVDANNTYANVGAFVIQRVSDGEILPICTGTLIAPTVFLTAGHCTAYFATLTPGAYVAGVSFEVSIAWGALTGSHPKFIRATSVITNPDYNQRQSDPADLGVLIIAARDTRGITPATLPAAGLLDQLFAAGVLNSARFVAVGYGLQNRSTGGGTPTFADLNPEPRQYAFSSFNSLGPGYLRLSQNPSTGNGGTCFGDSGGPNFLPLNGALVLAATTVTGDATCRSTNVDYRLDTETARRFLGNYVSLP
jgi:trypsin